MSDSQFAGGIVYRPGEDGLEYLVIEYDSGQGIQIKFPGGTNNDHPGEPIFDTLCREYPDETGLRLHDPKPVHSESKKQTGGGEHHKIWFTAAFEQCEGELRTEPKKDGGDLLSPPFWRTYQELKGKIYYTHAKALEKAERWLSKTMALSLK
jgi:ADP-ribose pyrophosphatase YjhB (NUDIX family)